MAMRIVKISEPPPKARPRKERDYLAFLHELPCVVTGKLGVQAAHVSFPALEYGHFGRGKQTKASDRWALPLTAEEHRRQHSMSERDYWTSVGRNPHELALIIHGLWCELGSNAPLRHHGHQPSGPRRLPQWLRLSTSA